MSGFLSVKYATSCQRCKSERVATMEARCDDNCSVSINKSFRTINDYVPKGLAVGEDDHIAFSWCLDCGQIQDTFPLPQAALEDIPTEVLD